MGQPVCLQSTGVLDRLHLVALINFLFLGAFSISYSLVASTACVYLEHIKDLLRDNMYFNARYTKELSVFICTQCSKKNYSVSS
jgi:hypothetical protein